MSIFKSLAEHINNILTLPTNNVVEQRNIFLAQVLNVITGEQLEEGILNGAFGVLPDPLQAYNFVGAIRYKRQGTDDSKYEDTVNKFAFPSDKGNMRMPLPGDLVLIVTANSSTSTPQRTVDLYMSVITGADTTRYHAKPSILTPKNLIDSNAVTALLSDAQEKQAQKRFQIGLQHNAKVMVEEGRTITNMREGDMVRESRFGSSIKFTSTIQKEGVWSDTQLTHKDTTIDGDPFIIIRNSAPLEPETKPEDTSLPRLIDSDPDKDQSSIYISTSQNIPMEVKGSNRMDTWAVDIIINRARTSREGKPLLSFEDVAGRLQEYFPDDYDPLQQVTANASFVIPQEAFDDNPNNDKLGGEGGTNPVPITGPASTRQEQLVKQALEASFAQGETKHKCSRGTFNHANNYVLLLKGQQAIPGMNVSAGGNANGSGFHNHMAQIGYSKYEQAGLTKAQLISICKDGPLDASNNHIAWNVGDAITYWASDGSPSDSHVQYGHAQMYVGGLTGIGQWSTDNRANYGGSYMVYRSVASNIWNAVIFRAPKA